MLEVLARRLESVGIATQPEVGSRILELVSEPDAQVADFAKVVRTDAALAGRLLRMVNSAYFAQTRTVTSLERACSLLGIERLRSFSLGFYLSRSAASERGAGLSRQVWGQSVFRACLGAELARRVVARAVSEAFVIGLMLDCGIPLMPRLAGNAAAEILELHEPPGRQFAMEFETLPFTHVDVATAMAAQWKLPELLARPIEWHHTPPGDSPRDDSVHALHRIAYYVGLIDLDRVTGTATQPAPLPGVAQRALGLSPEELAGAVGRATKEYEVSVGLFGEVADCVADSESLAARVHNQLIEVLDKAMSQKSGEPALPAARPRFALGGFMVELERGTDGDAVAVLYDSSGNALLCHRFLAAGTTPERLRAALGLDPGSGDQLEQIGTYLRGLAA